jgi:signal transduction histidine kinase
MKSTLKIIITVVIQISLILTSFSLLGYYESKQKPFYEIVNYAGKNRYLTEKTEFETLAYINGYYYTTDPVNTLTELEGHIKILKEGGTISGDIIPPLPNNLLPLWISVNQNFNIYKATVEEIRHVAMIEGGGITQTTFNSLQEKGDNMIKSSDNLVEGVANYSENMSYFVLELQAILMLINIASHILAVIKILNLIKKDSTKIKKLDKLAIIGETAARLGHDLRNPLSIIKMNLDIMNLKSKNVELDPVTQKRYNTINKAISRMSHQIEDVLDFVRTKPLELDNHSLLEIISDAADKITKPENVKIKLPQNDVKVMCDAKRLEVVFINLITNAIQAIGDKGVIAIKITADKENAYVSVQDSGIGISHDDMPKIFDPLFTTRQTGTGLGLPSCKNIVEQHNGKISVKNNPTTFKISIPKIRDTIVVIN